MNQKLILITKDVLYREQHCRKNNYIAKLLGIFVSVVLMSANLTAQTNIFVGTGTVNPSVGSNPGSTANGASPYGYCTSSGAMGKKLQIIYTAADIGAAMTTAGYSIGSSFIHNIAFDVSTATGAANAFNGYTIKMANVAQTNFAGAGSPYTGSLTTVYGPNNITYTAGTGFVMTFTLPTPFQWDGTSSLLVEVCYTATTPFLITTYGSCRRTNTSGNQMLYNGGASINCATSTYATAVAGIPNARLNVSSATPCSGAPALANVVAGQQCMGNGQTLTLSGLAGAAGYTYLWKQSNTSGGPYTNASGINNTATYTTPGVLPFSTTYYKCEVTCSNSGLTTPSNYGTATYANFLTCYCNTDFSSAAATTVRGLRNVTLAGNNVTINNNTSANTANPSPYNLYATPVADLTTGSNYSLLTTVGTATNNLHYVKAWIDYDQDGMFGGYTSLGLADVNGDYGIGGLVYERIGAVGPTTNVQSTSNFTVPAAATPGVTGMRVRYRYGASNAAVGSCVKYTGSATGGGAGEVEDYRVDIQMSCTAPSVSSSAGNVSPLNTDNATLNWTNGNGTGGRLVLLRQGAAVNAGPTSGTTYTANAAFGSGQQLGTGNFAVYNSTGSSVAITGLLPNTSYYYAIYEFNTLDVCYESAAYTGNFTTASCHPSTQPSAMSACTEYDKINLSFTPGNGTHTIVLARAGSAVNADPEYNTSYTGNSLFGSGSQIGTGNFVVYDGSGVGSVTVPVSGLNPNTTYHFKAYEYNASPNCYNVISPLTGSYSTRMPATYTSSTTTQVSTSVEPNTLAAEVIRLDVVVAGGTDPALYMNSITFKTTGTTNTATDLINAKVYYTGTSNAFAAKTQFGSTFTAFAGNLTANGNIALSPGTNYFWVAYDLNLNATLGNKLDAEVVSFTVTDINGSSVKIPSVTSPAGDRTIALLGGSYCTPSHNNSVGDCISTVAFAGTNYTGGNNCGNYGNYTALPAPTVTPGSTYTLSYYADDFIGNTNSAYIDWNQDGTFGNSAGEQITIDHGSFSVSLSVTVPLTAVPGTTRLRIVNRFPSAGSNPCIGSNGSSTSGVTSDFTVVVPGGGGGSQAVSCPTAQPTVTSPVNYNQGDAASALTATGTSLLWFTSPTAGTGSATAPTPSTAAAGTTNYYVTQNDGSCESPRIQIAVYVAKTPCGPTQYAVTGTSACYNVTVGLANSQTGVSYQLYLDGNPVGAPISGTDGTPISFGTQSTAGLYTVKGTDSQPVTTTMSGNVRLYANPVPTITGTLLGCLPSGVNLSASTSTPGNGTISSYQWQENSVDIPSATNVGYNTTISNNYTVVVTNSYGCTAVSAPSTVVVNTPSSASGSGPLFTCENGIITVSGASAANGTISWTLNQGNGSLSNTSTLTPTYTAVAADAGTTVKLTLTVSNPPCANATYVQDIIVRPRPTLNPSSISICVANPSEVINVVNPQPNTDYKWSPANDLYLDAALSIPYTLNTPATTVWTAPFGNITYHVTATNTDDNCTTGMTDILVSVCPTLTQSICNADGIPPIPVTNSAVFTSYSLTGAGFSGGSSCAPIKRDIWYRAQVPANGELHVVTAPDNNPIANLNIQSAVVTIFTGPNCNSVASVACNQGGAAGEFSYTHAYGLTPGSMAYIRIGSTIANNALAAQFIKMAVTSGLVWTAAFNDDFSNPANWHGGDATALTVTNANRSAIIPHNVTKPKLLSNANVKGMSFTSAPPYFISPGIDLNGYTLNVKGDWQVGPSVASSTTLNCNGIVEFNGTGATAQMVSGKTTFGNLTTNNTTAGVTLNSPTGVSCVLTTTAGNLNSNGKLILRSTATNTALVKPMSGNVMGDVSVERKIGSTTGYHYLTSPVNGALVNNTTSGWRDDFTILASLDGQIFIPGTIYQQLASVWEYNESNSNPNPAFGWIATTGTTDPITPLKGFACVIPANTVVDVFGPLTNGIVPGGYGISRTLGTGAGEGLNAIGNPYPSPISWNAFRALPANSSLLSTNGYQTFISSGGYVGSYGSWNGTVGSPISVTDRIASSQGIMVDALATGTINADNSVRLTSAGDVSATFFGYNSVPDLMRMEITGNGYASETALYFDAAANDQYEPSLDAKSIPSIVNGFPNIYSYIDNQHLNINAMGKLNSNKVVPLGLTIRAAGNYTLKATDMSTFAPSVIAYLEDVQAGTITNLRTQPSYTVTLPAGVINNRFLIHFHPAVELQSINETCLGNDGKLIINYPTTSTVNILVKDESGTIITTLNNVSGSVSVSNLAAGNYALEMTFGMAPNTYTTTDYFSIGEGNAVYANMSASATTVDMAANTTVLFTATAQGATGFNWNFGDGTIINNGPANIAHTFTQAGIYEVSFEAGNGLCTATATTTVEVTNTTGLTALAASNIVVHGVGDKVSIQFGNKLEGTGSVEVINMLGEVISHIENVPMKGQKEIALTNIAAGQYMVKILSNNQLFTKKIYLSRQ